MKQGSAKGLLRDLCVIMIAALALMTICLLDMMNGGQIEAHALDYRVNLKSVKPYKGGYKVTWAKPDIKVKGFRIKVASGSKTKYYYAGSDATSKTIYKFGKQYINMFKQSLS